MIHEAEFYRDLLNSVSDGVYFLDRERRITFWNKGAERISGYSSEEAVGSQCRDHLLNHVDERGRSLCADACPASVAIESGQSIEMEAFLHHKDGHRVPVSIKTVPFRNAEGQVTGAVETFSETSSRSEYERRFKEMEGLAMQDPVTGVGNRRYGERRIISLLNELDRYDWPFGLLFADVDHFKAVNDTYGHDAGDAVLHMVAQTLISNVRSFDHVIRWGGEEFLILVVNVNTEQLGIVAEKLRALVEKSELERNGRCIRVTVSMGGSICTDDDDEKTLVARADGLMYESKQAGRNRVTIG
ncbi:MAG TPA: GGDEF domain-containing protein [Candidatus Hydrogenedentes bacterium]|nr:GGDEF domain-containing protein [Candidatus Hydrogenedentota bacterium]HPG68166.1 GGDEF domain-containing protein [Candidatus Hydrogenedentota bacterium]